MHFKYKPNQMQETSAQRQTLKSKVKNCKEARIEAKQQIKD